MEPARGGVPSRFENEKHQNVGGRPSSSSTGSQLSHTGESEGIVCFVNESHWLE